MAAKQRWAHISTEKDDFKGFGFGRMNSLVAETQYRIGQYMIHSTALVLWRNWYNAVHQEITSFPVQRDLSKTNCYEGMNSTIACQAEGKNWAKHIWAAPPTMTLHRVSHVDITRSWISQIPVIHQHTEFCCPRQLLKKGDHWTINKLVLLEKNV